MAYDDEQRSSRIVVDTPSARREVTRTETSRAPGREGMSGGVVAAIVVGAVALVTIVFLFLMNNQQNANNNTRLAEQPVTTQPQQPIIIQQPGAPTQQPIVIQQPAQSTQQVPIIVQPSGTDDSTIQSNIDKKISEDTTLAPLDVTVTVVSGRATLMGTVNSETLKSRVERTVNSVKGVSGVDNKIIVATQ